MAQQRGRVLVIEDDEVVGAVIEDALGERGYTVRLEVDGRAGLVALRAWPADLILLDLMMPGMDGIAFRAAQRADPRLAGIPVVVLSARHDAAAHGEALAAAAVVPKPFDLTMLLTVVERCLAR